MGEPTHRKVAAIDGQGRFVLLTEPVPEPGPGEVLVQNKATLISPGTELGGVEALRRSPRPDAAPRPFGYSSAGLVLRAGPGCPGLETGMRVACMGAGYALHSDYVVVPRNLVVPLPEGLDFEQAAFAHLAATALHALRRLELRIGEEFLVVGLGLVGQLAVQLARAAGAHVAGLDPLPMRRDRAARGGAALTLSPDDDVEGEMVRFTAGRGLDCALVAYGGDATETVRRLLGLMSLAPDGHRYGRIGIVGGANFQTRGWPVAAGNVDVRACSRPGPGYHDEAWERGADYPHPWVRWTTRANMQVCLRLAAEGRIDPSILVTHRLPLERFAEGAEALVSRPDEALGVVLLP